MRFPLTILAALALAPAAASAQSAFLELEGTGAALEFRRPTIDGSDLDLFTGTYFLIGHHALGHDDARVVVEIPWARIGTDRENPLTGEEYDSESALGNVYVGYGRRVGTYGTGFDVGLRLPTSDSETNPAGFLGFRSSLIDRIGAFSPETVSLIGGVEGGAMPAEHTTLRFRAGLTYAHYTGDRDVDGEAYARLTGQSMTHIGPARVGAGLETLFVMTSDGNAGERSFIDGVLAAGYDFGMVSAGLQFRLPLDEDHKDFVEYVLGLSLEVRLR